MIVEAAALGPRAGPRPRAGFTRPPVVERLPGPWCSLPSGSGRGRRRGPGRPARPPDPGPSVARTVEPRSADSLDLWVNGEQMIFVPGAVSTPANITALDTAVELGFNLVQVSSVSAYESNDFYCAGTSSA